jgi:hypothetical protein
MDFFHSLSLDLKLLVVAIAGTALLALFSGNHKSEKRYMVVFALLAAVGVYRFNTGAPVEPEQRSAAAPTTSQPATTPAKRAPLTSTSSGK